MSKRRSKRPGRKLLGLDLGERRIGVAVTDDTGILASPVRIVDLRREGLQQVAEIARERQVAGIIAGLPTNLSGQEGFQANRTREMAAQLEELVDVPIIFWDERLTTAIADQMLADKRRGSKKGRRKQRDAIAAAILLQDYLEANPM